MSAGLEAAGIAPGAKVALALYNGNEYVEAEFAAFKARAVPCNVNYRYVADEIRYVLDNADAEAVFYDATLRDRIDEVVLSGGDEVQIGKFRLVYFASPADAVTR